MRNLINFLAKYNNLVIFLILEGFSFYLLFNGNDHHNTLILKNIRGLTMGLEERVGNTKSYFRLNQINIDLAKENALLRNQVERLTNSNSQEFYTLNDSANSQTYVYSMARLTGNSINKQKNFFTLNKGSDQGMAVDMAVISGSGAAGVIVGCSRNFSVAMSLINIDFRLSARIRSNGFFGSLTWDGKDYTHAILNEIPQHVDIAEGDTIETTGYSAIFPEGIMIGTVSDFERPGSDFYQIRVALATDFKKLRYVNVIGNLRKDEQLDLENSFR
jgi:rod shape-determining protein MreC